MDGDNNNPSVKVTTTTIIVGYMKKQSRPAYIWKRIVQSSSKFYSNRTKLVRFSNINDTYKIW